MECRTKREGHLNRQPDDNNVKNLAVRVKNIQDAQCVQQTCEAETGVINV